MEKPKLNDYLKAHHDVWISRYSNRNGDMFVLRCTGDWFSVTTIPGLSALYQGKSFTEALRMFEGVVKEQ